MRPVLFHVGDIAIPSFWVMAFLGFFAAFLVARRNLTRNGYGARMAYDITLWAYVGGWVGARLFTIPTGWDYFIDDPLRFLVSSSGWVWYGGVVGGMVAAGLWGRWYGPGAYVVGDIVAPALAVGQAIGRIGCQLAGDGDYGIPSDLPWAMSYPDGEVPTVERVHPTPLYECAANLLIFVILWRRPTPRIKGAIWGEYMIYSGVARFLVEFVRRHPAWLLFLTTAQWLSILSIGVGWLIVRGKFFEQAPRAHDPG